jgi:hypothetical protein
MSVKIDFTEEDLEDFVFKRLKKELNIKPVVRQFQTPAGVLDVLGRSLDNPAVYLVIELKKNTIDTDAICQCLRYTKFLNEHMSKKGTRCFVPLLIGRDLENSKNVIRLVEEYDRNDSYDIECAYGKVFYQLYGYNLENGASLSWFSTYQREYYDEVQKSYNTSTACLASKTELIVAYQSYINIQKRYENYIEGIIGMLNDKKLKKSQIRAILTEGQSIRNGKRPTRKVSDTDKSPNIVI